jgi:uncharacterized protein YndB with AHSA1/START domain
MPTYLITNRVPDGFTPSPEAFAAWTAWFDSLGDAVADRGNPAFVGTTAGSCGPGTMLGGYTLITANDLDAAAGLVADHPLMTRGGGVEVAELTPINEGTRLRSSREFSVTTSVHVAAPPEEVFGYFTDPARYVRWMGAEAKLTPVPGGEYRIRMGDGFEAAGEFTELDPPRRLVFTWGFADDEAAKKTKNPQAGEAASGSVMPAGSTRVTVTFKPEGPGTRLTLAHDRLPNIELETGHKIAWDTYLPRLVIHVAGGDPGSDPHA